MIGSAMLTILELEFWKLLNIGYLGFRMTFDLFVLCMCSVYVYDSALIHYMNINMNR